MASRSGYIVNVMKDGSQLGCMKKTVNLFIVGATHLRKYHITLKQNQESSANPKRLLIVLYP